MRRRSSRGSAAKAADIGEAVTLFHGVNVAYGPKVSGTAMSPGAALYLSATVDGGLADAATTGGTVAIARVIDTDGRIFFRGNWD